MKNNPGRKHARAIARIRKKKNSDLSRKKTHKWYTHDGMKNGGKK